MLLRSVQSADTGRVEGQHSSAETRLAQKQQLLLEKCLRQETRKTIHQDEQSL
jgi:hypothetical protein